MPSQSIATIVPSRFAPIFTRMCVPGVGPVASNTSARVMYIFTGRWPALRDSSAASGSMYTELLPPKPPPISAGLTRTFEIGCLSSVATLSRTPKYACGSPTR